MTVSRTSEALGVPASDWAPSEYGSYIATSNAVYVCVSRRAELLARLPLRIYREDAAGEQTDVTSGPLYDRLTSPNPQYSGQWLVEMTQMDLDLWGRAFWMLERGKSGRGPVREIWRARPDRVTVIPSRETYIQGYALTDVDGGHTIPYTADEVIYFRYPNPLDELSGLSPLAAARLAADTGSAAMKANYNLFNQGMLGGGMLTPTDKEQIWTADQMKDMASAFERQLKGVDKAHRWAIFRTPVHAERLSFSPEDMQHLETLKYTLEDVARAYRIPIDMLRGETTYENLDAAYLAVYTHAVLPAAWRMTETINNRLVPRFPGQRVRVEFDASDVEVLQENRAEVVTQMDVLFKMGVPLNVLLAQFMPQLMPEDGEGYAWGDVAWMPMSLVPTSSAEPKPEPSPEPEPPPDEEPLPTIPPEEPRTLTRQLETYGSREHVEVWRAFDDRVRPFERLFVNLVTQLFVAQRKSVLAKLGAPERSARMTAAELDDLWNTNEWIRKAREMARPLYKQIALAGWAGAAGSAAPNVLDIIMGRSQRFAERVNDTTWTLLKDGLMSGIKEGEGTDKLAARVTEIMGDRIRSSAETIARTEVVGSYNEAGLAGAIEIGAKVKQWIATMDERTRDEHVSLHGEAISVDEDFESGTGNTGPGPGQMGEEDDINCRCTLVYE